MNINYQNTLYTCTRGVSNVADTSSIIGLSSVTFPIFFSICIALLAIGIVIGFIVGASAKK